MARGGRRTYTRDSRGRFSSAPGGGLGAARKAARSQSGRASTLGARTSLKASRAKLRAKDPADQQLSTALSTRAQKGAVTRGNRGLKAAKTAAQTRIAGGRKGVIGKPKGLKPGALAERRARRNDEPVIVQKASTAKGYRIPRRPAPAATTKTPPSTGSKPKPAPKAGTDAGSKMERSISGITDRRLRKSASPEKQFKALQTQQRAAQYLRAASKFAEKNNISLERALRSGPKNSTGRKKIRRKPKP